jgi:hypothetical protein
MVVLIFSTASAFGQYDFIVLKKRNKSVQYFWKDSYIAFQLKDGQWIKGIITKIEKDFFYLRIEKISHSLMGPDTVHFSGFRYAISDIYAIPKKGLQIDYMNGRFDVNRAAGHVHWYWIKSGWLFRVGAIGYAVLNVSNGLLKKDLSSSRSGFGIAAAVFSGGVVLHKIYKPYFRLGKRYHLEASSVSQKNL